MCSNLFRNSIRLLAGVSLVCTCVVSASGPYVSGNKIYHADGRRLIFKGINLEFGRYTSDPTPKQYADATYANRTTIAAAFYGYGINAVRINIGTDFYTLYPDYFSKLADMVDLFASQGIYSMICDHNYTGQTLTNCTNSFSTFTQVFSVVRQKGRENFLIMNPYNEPGPIQWNAWVTATRSTLNQLRTVNNFHGLIIFDCLSWACSFDAASADSSINYDKSVNSGVANVAFSNHFYPNEPTSSTFPIMDNCGNYPLIMGEVGQYNGGGIDVGYNDSTLDYVINTEIPKGHNGVFPWIWYWCDANTMSDNSTFNDFGNACNAHFYTKVADNFADAQTGVSMHSIRRHNSNYGQNARELSEYDFLGRKTAMLTSGFFIAAGTSTMTGCSLFRDGNHVAIEKMR